MKYSLLSTLLLSATGAFGFSNSPTSNRGLSTKLHGIAEWRDFPSGITFDGEDEAYDELNYGPSARRVPVVVVRPDQAVLQGEKKYFHFLSNDELRIFQQALDRNHGIFALGVLISEDNDDDDVIMNKLQLMEIKEYKMDLGVDFGIFCTAQAVGKANLLSLMGSNEESSVEEKESDQQLIAICEEHFDDQETYYSFEESNQMARDLLQIVKKLSQKEEQERREQAAGNEHGIKILFDINKVNEKESETEEDEDEDEEQTRGDRFTLAYLDALESDSQGYISNALEEREGLLSWKEMNAISWAAFSSDLISSEEASMRLHAFDQDRITDRLKLASYWLADIFEGVEYGSNSR